MSLILSTVDARIGHGLQYAGADRFTIWWGCYTHIGQGRLARWRVMPGASPKVGNP